MTTQAPTATVDAISTFLIVSVRLFSSTFAQIPIANNAAPTSYTRIASISIFCSTLHNRTRLSFFHNVLYHFFHTSE